MATKTYKKFLTGAATAAMVVSAVAPVAAQGQDVADQANSSFSDIGPSSSHYTNVIEARELGFLSGYTDGTFKPNKDLNRGDVAKMLGKYVVASSGLTLDEYVAANNIADVENFSDVPDTAKDQELVTYSKIVKDAGIFQGSNNNLMATKLMPRDQIAAVLVRAFDLKDKEGATDVKDGANSGYVKEIEILLENGVSNANPYRPFETTSRAQFASFLVRAYKVSEGLDPSKPLPEEPGEETPGVDWEGDFEVEVSKNSLKADGKDNAIVTFTFKDKDGNVDTTVNDVVLGLSATYGSFASETVTVENGVAKVQLTSEQSNSDVRSRIDAVIVEAGEGNKSLIGNVAATAYVDFVVNDGVEETLNLTKAESNQADRVTLHFDRDVTLEDFAQTLPRTGEALYNVEGRTDNPVTKAVASTYPADVVTLALAPEAIVVTQGETAKAVKGIKLTSTPNVVEVILEKDSDLANNQAVDVEVNYTSKYGETSNSAKSFTLTDARPAEVTEITNEGMKTVNVKFSEAIDTADFKVDAGTQQIESITLGEFHPATQEDNRNRATIQLATWLKAGQHGLEVSKATDFAGNEYGQTQNLTFNVAANTTKPVVDTRVVASPEQFHFFFNAPVSGDLANSYTLERYDEDNDRWEAVTDLPLVPELLPNRTEFVIELGEDWTEYYNTATTKENFYNDQYRVVFAKDTLTNLDNGLKNDRFVVELSNDTALSNPDNTSPVIETVTQVSSNTYQVKASEPVKLAGKDSAGDTLSQSQNDLPTVKAEFVGTDADGKPVTINGTVGNYTNKNDDTFNVSANLQALVDQGYGTEWTLTLRQLTDDVGNSAVTTSDTFTVNPTVINPLDTPFKINATSARANADGSGNIIIDFTEGVQYQGGANDATDIKNYTLNGKDLPAGTTFTVGDWDQNDKNGLGSVVIYLPEGALETGSNVINVKRDLVSYDGSVLEGSNEIVVPTTAQ
ncbi:S-layer homology domain-containing protein [Bhargavaea ginsengi]|uniref:S-layer homology domain-containing protein n=1 Tax=Bhargavaea ginsengi TaxID=426757 RepID=UPI003C759980